MVGVFFVLEWVGLEFCRLMLKVCELTLKTSELTLELCKLTLKDRELIPEGAHINTEA